jgi:hypothetical protein
VAVHSEILPFRRSDPAPLVAVMRGLAATGEGWVNLQARFPDEDQAAGPQRPRAGVFALFRGKGPTVPVLTWVPWPPGQRGVPVDSLGVQHGAGPKAVARLADAGLAVPAGWRTAADHPGRGLVLELPPGTDPEDVLRWALPASQVLSEVELPDTWVASIDRR